MAVRCRKGRIHDFRILKEDCPAIHPEITKLGDSGYQGIDKLYSNTRYQLNKAKISLLLKKIKNLINSYPKKE